MADQLTLNPEFLQALILKARAAMVQPGHKTDDEGNFEDDESTPARSAALPNLSDDELIGLIEDLEPDQQAELVALFWIGRGDMEPEEWTDAVRLAVERREGSTAEYLLSHPHIAEHWGDALDRIFDGTGVMDGGSF